MTVYIGIEGKYEHTIVHQAREYQESAFLTFMSNDAVQKIHFKYPDNIIFNLQKFNMEGLERDYPKFCILENDKNEKHILSDDEQLLRGFVGWKNRLIDPIAMMGGYKKKSTKRKQRLQKKKSVTKKKSTKR
jgi:hypothetical protein